MESSALIVVFKEDITKAQERELAKHLYSLPYVATVKGVQPHPARQAIIDQERARIEERLRSMLPSVAPPDLLLAMILAVRSEQ